MKQQLTLLFIALQCACSTPQENSDTYQSREDSLALVSLVTIREQAMISKDINTAMSQFANEATWINSQGYFFQGINSVEKFHAMLAGNDSLDYYYEAGNPRVSLIDHNNGLVYYGWKMFWFRKENPSDTTFREIGLMTLSANKRNGEWKWVAVTNQHTPWFYQDILPVDIP